MTKLCDVLEQTTCLVINVISETERYSGFLESCEQLFKEVIRIPAIEVGKPDALYVGSEFMKDVYATLHTLNMHPKDVWLRTPFGLDDEYLIKQSKASSLYRSVVRALTYAIDNDLKSIMIMEDDCRLRPNVYERMRNATVPDTDMIVFEGADYKRDLYTVVDGKKVIHEDVEMFNAGKDSVYRKNRPEMFQRAGAYYLKGDAIKQFARILTTHPAHVDIAWIPALEELDAYVMEPNLFAQVGESTIVN